MEILPRIKGPSDLKGLSIPEKVALSAEIRQFLVENLARNGGHLSGNLGIVELTIALHQAFDFSKDRIVWDVGHQSYVHKILTGRKERFSTIRNYGGLSGFPEIHESPEFDHFGTGHSSTSISAIHGMAVARDKKGEKHHCVAFIGDGAMTGGMAYEALNNIGSDRRKVIVILNDNGMSISPNVGSFSSYLNKIRVEPFYYQSKDYVENFLNNLPPIGPVFKDFLGSLKKSIRRLTIPGLFFEELGLKYLGPVDGYNHQMLSEVLEYARSLDKPCLVHVLTVKGKGYKPAEGSVPSFHGCGAFHIPSGEHVKKSGALPSLSEIMGETLILAAKKFPEIQVITPATKEGSGLVEFENQFPNQFWDTGIAEQHAVTFAGGLAISGLKPVVAIYSTFLQRGYDQVIHDIAVQNLPVLFALDRAGIVPDGATHQGVFDIAFLRPIPNLVLMAPRDEIEMQKMVKTAIQLQKPAVIRYPRSTSSGQTLFSNWDEIPTLKEGSWEILQGGKDGSLITFGSMVPTARQVLLRLRKDHHIQLQLVDARFLKPMDEKILKSLAGRGKPLITLEEHSLTGGFGSALLEWLSDYGSENGISLNPLLRLGIPDRFLPHGNPDLIRNGIGLSPDQIFERIYNFLPYYLKNRAETRTLLQANKTQNLSLSG